MSDTHTEDGRRKQGSLLVPLWEEREDEGDATKEEEQFRIKTVVSLQQSCLWWWRRLPPSRGGERMNERLLLLLSASQARLTVKTDWEIQTGKEGKRSLTGLQFASPLFCVLWVEAASLPFAVDAAAFFYCLWKRTFCLLPGLEPGFPLFFLPLLVSRDREWQSIGSCFWFLSTRSINKSLLRCTSCKTFMTISFASLRSFHAEINLLLSSFSLSLCLCLYKNCILVRILEWPKIVSQTRGFFSNHSFVSRGMSQGNRC